MLRSLWSRFVAWWRRALCVSMGGHYKTRVHEPSRLALKCVGCGHETRGWDIGPSRVKRSQSQPTTRTFKLVRNG